MDDREIVARLKAKLGIIGEGREKYDEQGRLVGLDLSRLGITQLPEELGQLVDLQALYLQDNRLTDLPVELVRLTSLQRLNLSDNQLTRLPKELGLLTNLQRLDLHNNNLTQIPIELETLKNLNFLDLGSNYLTELPVALKKMTRLQELHLYSNQFVKLSEGIGQLVNLEHLGLSHNRLVEISDKIKLLTQLRRLYLYNNRLTQIPVTIGELTDLQELWLDENPLKELPIELGQLTNLQELSLYDHPNLLTPPPEIVAMGTQEMLAFLRELHHASVQRYETKLLLLGEGGTGKSSLLRALCGKKFEANLDTTHGIAIESVRIPHPQFALQRLKLNTWDFGGQDIYHATHQFFLTRRSVYVVVWNARTGSRDSKLDYWLDTIHVLAPDVPIVLVATHVDERAPDLNVQQYRSAYPQIVDVLSVSNKKNEGLEALKGALALHAASLPLIGQPWPTAWVSVEQVLLALPEHHISADHYMDICQQKGVQAEIAQGTLGSYLHDLGKVLYFRDDQILSRIVVLKPNWVTKAISLVLEDPATRAANGILTHADLPRIWSVDEDGQPYARSLYPIFLRLMERFDLSYQIEPMIPGQQPTHSLIPQLLPYEEPSGIQSIWPPDTTLPDQMHVEMVYRFDFVPAGIMSWFIVRTHRYTRKLHWRDGAILSYEGHLARIELFPMLRKLRIVVRGIQPYTFFVILKETLDLILTRFKGLQVRREVPCTCQSKTGAPQPCKEVYRYEEDLVRRFQHNKPMIECPTSYTDLSVVELLYGIHMSTTPQILTTIEAGTQEILRRLTTLQQKDDLLLQRISLLMEWSVRNFTRLWNLEMKRMEVECPNIFFLIPDARKRFDPRQWIGYKYKLYLVCQHPSGPHIVEEEHGYDLDIPKEWWKTVAPWLKYMITFLKFGIPLGDALGAIIDTVDLKAIENQLKLLETITADLPGVVVESNPVGNIEKDLQIGREQVVGPALRVLHSLLDQVDKQHYWGGLQRVVTEDGNILWLCGEHAKPYEVQVLRLE